MVWQGCHPPTDPLPSRMEAWAIVALAIIAVLLVAGMGAFALGMWRLSVASSNRTEAYHTASIVIGRGTDDVSGSGAGGREEELVFDGEGNRLTASSVEEMLREQSKRGGILSSGPWWLHFEDLKGTPIAVDVYPLSLRLTAERTTPDPDRWMHDLLAKVVLLSTQAQSNQRTPSAAAPGAASANVNDDLGVATISASVIPSGHRYAFLAQETTSGFVVFYRVDLVRLLSRPGEVWKTEALPLQLTVVNESNGLSVVSRHMSGQERDAVGPSPGNATVLPGCPSPERPVGSSPARPHAARMGQRIEFGVPRFAPDRFTGLRVGQGVALFGAAYVVAGTNNVLRDEWLLRHLDHFRAQRKWGTSFVVKAAVAARTAGPSSDPVPLFSSKALVYLVSFTRMIVAFDAGDPVLVVAEVPRYLRYKFRDDDAEPAAPIPPPSPQANSRSGTSRRHNGQGTTAISHPQDSDGYHRCQEGDTVQLPVGAWCLRVESYPPEGRVTRPFDDDMGSGSAIPSSAVANPPLLSAADLLPFATYPRSSSVVLTIHAHAPSLDA